LAVDTDVNVAHGLTKPIEIERHLRHRLQATNSKNKQKWRRQKRSDTQHHRPRPKALPRDDADNIDEDARRKREQARNGNVVPKSVERRQKIPILDPCDLAVRRRILFGDLSGAVDKFADSAQEQIVCDDAEVDAKVPLKLVLHNAVAFKEQYPTFDALAKVQMPELLKFLHHCGRKYNLPKGVAPLRVLVADITGIDVPDKKR
jgi:hypothetical protein